MGPAAHTAPRSNHQHAQRRAQELRAAFSANGADYTNSSAGGLETWSSDGKLIRRTSINAGDTVTVFTGWRFHGGHFDGQEVLSVLSRELANLSTLSHDAESRLDTNR